MAAILLLFLLGFLSVDCAVVSGYATANCSDATTPSAVPLGVCVELQSFHVIFTCDKGGSWVVTPYGDDKCTQTVPIAPMMGDNDTQCVVTPLGNSAIQVNCSATLDVSSSSDMSSNTSSSDVSSNTSSSDVSSNMSSSDVNSSSTSSSETNSSSSSSSSEMSSSSSSQTNSSSSSEMSSSSSSSSEMGSSSSSSSSSSDVFVPGNDLTIHLCLGSGTKCTVCTPQTIVFNLTFGNDQCFPFSSPALKAAIPAAFLGAISAIPGFYDSSAKAACTKASSAFNFYTEGACTAPANQSITIPANGCAALVFGSFPLSATATCKNPTDGGTGGSTGGSSGASGVNPSAVPSLFAFVSVLLTTVTLRNALM